MDNENYTKFYLDVKSQGELRVWRHVSFWGIKGNTKAFSWGNMKERDHLEDLDVDLRKIIKRDLRWDGMVDWIYVTQDTDRERDRDKCPYVVNTLLNLRVLYRWKLLAERLSVSEEGRGCVELVGFTCNDVRKSSFSQGYERAATSSVWPTLKCCGYILRAVGVVVVRMYSSSPIYKGNGKANSVQAWIGP